MKKRIIIFSSLFVLVVSFLVISWFHFQPKEAALIKTEVISTENTELTYANIEKHILSDDKVHYLWVCSMNNPDCIYTRDYIIKSLSDELGEDNKDFDNIEFVDFTEAPDTAHYRQTYWNIQNFPAFIAVKNTDGQLEILNTISWSKEAPLTADTLKTWMYENNIWTGKYEIIELIDQALE